MTAPTGVYDEVRSKPVLKPLMPRQVRVHTPVTARSIQPRASCSRRGVWSPSYASNKSNLIFRQISPFTPLMFPIATTGQSPNISRSTSVPADHLHDPSPPPHVRA